MQKGLASSEFIIKSNKSNTIITGYASVFNVVDNHNDSIIKGAFQSSKTNLPKLLWQHDTSRPIGIITSISEDQYGLKIEAEINNQTKDGFDASALIKQKAVGGLSIGFNIKSYDYNANGQRVITDLDLMEISVVTFPANDMAVIDQVKSDQKKINIEDEAINKLEKLIKQLINL